MTMHRLATTLAAVAIMLPAAATARAQAQDAKYPAKQVNFVVAFAAGGFADTLARFVAQKLNDKWGQPVVIENRGGAGGNLAARTVRAAEPDGYTVLVTTTALAINPTMYKKLDFSVDELAAVEGTSDRVFRSVRGSHAPQPYARVPGQSAKRRPLRRS